MPGYFFISYASEDTDHAYELCRLLESVGASYWMAPHSIPPGEFYPVAIARAIREADALLLLFSRSSDESPEVLSEVSLARKHKKKIVPVRIENFDPMNLEYYLQVPQWVDYHGPAKAEAEQKIKKLVIGSCNLPVAGVFEVDDRSASGPQRQHSVVEDAKIAAGARLGPYEVVSVLKDSGISEVYKVRHLVSGHLDIVELPRIATEDGDENLFLNGMAALARLDHLNIVKIKSAIKINGRPGVVTEYFEAVSVESLLNSGPFELAKAIHITILVLDALSHVHSQSVVHRDVKPQNILLASTYAVKLTGFHLACTQGNEGVKEGFTAGSLYYMSPEQIRGERLDGRADLYSLGVTLFEMITGTRPYTGQSDYDVMAAHIYAPVPDPSRIAPYAPTFLSHVVKRAMSKDKSERFQTAEEMRTTLSRSLESVSGAFR